MSRSKDTRPDPRIAIKEEIITRNKSAQLKRQLQEKESGSLKRPPSPVKAKKSRKSKNETEKKADLDVEPKRKIVKKLDKPSKPTVKKQPKAVKNKEYFPNNLKRPYKTDKVVLKPKTESKLIGGMNTINKRKLKIPKRVTGSNIDYKQSEDDHIEDKSELSMAELLRITEDTESLTEEDWLEILTCPSPVWWEDPPSPEYCEDPISTRLEDKECSRTNAADNNANADLQSEAILKVADLNTCIDLKQTDKKFMKKRNKLENLLGTIKNKLAPSDNLKVNTKKDNIGFSNSDYLNKNNNIDIQTDRAEDELQTIGNVDAISKSKCADDNILDTSLDDEVLETLESMYIPIENENEGIDNNRILENKEDILGENNLKTERVNSEMEVVEIDSNVELNNGRVPKKASLHDSIANEAINDSVDSIEIEPSTSAVEEYVTIYKVLSNENSIETTNVDEINESLSQNDDDRRKIDGFYKKRKHLSSRRNSNQKEATISERNNEKNKQNRQQKVVAVCAKQKIKYCTKCSSIFDTETCTYCDKRNDKDNASHGSNKSRLCAM